MQQHFLFVEYMLAERMTSIENSALKRYKLFQQFLGITPIYVSLDFNLNLEQHLDILKRKKAIPDHFRYVNVFEFWLKSDERKQVIKPAGLEKDIDILFDEKGNKRIEKIYRHQSPYLSQLNFYDENGFCYKIARYDRLGCLVCETVFDPQSQKKKLIYYYRQNGTLAASCLFRFIENEIERKNQICHAVIFDEQGEPLRTFATGEKFTFYLLENYLCHFSSSEQLNLFIDKHHYFPQFFQQKNQIQAKYKTFHIFHSIHQKDPYDKNSDSRMVFLRHGLLNKMDGVIVLTPQQADDIKQEFGDYGNVFCIPHAIEIPIRKADFAQRRKNRAIAAVRLSKEKRIDRMIRIFSLVVNKIPDAQLDIYGVGEQGELLEKLITELKLHKNVHLRGFSENLPAEFETAQCSLLTSWVEGQPLVILESLSYGCPVVSRNMKYGAECMLEDGKNGFLQPIMADEREEEAQFAEKIIHLFQQQELTQQLSQNAYESVKPFSPEAIAPLWKAFVEKIVYK